MSITFYRQGKAGKRTGKGCRTTKSYRVTGDDAELTQTKLYLQAAEYLTSESGLFPGGCVVSCFNPAYLHDAHDQKAHFDRQAPRIIRLVLGFTSDGSDMKIEITQKKKQTIGLQDDRQRPSWGYLHHECVCIRRHPA